MRDIVRGALALQRRIAGVAELGEGRDDRGAVGDMSLDGWRKLRLAFPVAEIDRAARGAAEGVLMIRLQRQQALKAYDRLVEAFQVAQRLAAVVERVDVIGPRRERLV